MPDKVINIPGIGPIGFPDSMSDEAVQAAAAKVYREHARKPSAMEQIGRGVTATLPVMGGVGGGMIGSAGPPILGTAAGVAGGTMAGEEARQWLNRLLFGDASPNPLDVMVSGATAGAGAGALEALPAVGAALRPGAVMNDVEQTGSVGLGKLGARMIRRAAASLRPTPPIFKRPLWQAQEGEFPPTQAEKDIAGTIGQPPPAPTSATIRPAEPDAWDRMLSEARQNRKPVGPPPTLRKGGSAPSVSDTLRAGMEEAGAPNPAKGTTPPPVVTTKAGKPSITAEDYARGEQGAAQPSATPPSAHAWSPPEPKSTPEPPAGGRPDMVEGGAGGDAAGLADDIARLRRKYGADRIGKAVSPATPEAGTGSVLRADATKAPSAMPDIAQESLLRDLKAGTSADPARTARAVKQLLTEYKRNGAVAKSPVAQELAALLKKHGFETP